MRLGDRHNLDLYEVYVNIRTECNSYNICVGFIYQSMRINITVLPIFVIISLLNMSIPAEQDSDTVGQAIDAQLGKPSDKVVSDNTNMTKISTSISGNASITPAPEVNDTLIGRSTPTTSNITVLDNEGVKNKTGEVEPLAGIK
jgi:hypothetical protein